MKAREVYDRVMQCNDSTTPSKMAYYIGLLALVVESMEKANALDKTPGPDPAGSEGMEAFSEFIMGQCKYPITLAEEQKYPEARHNAALLKIGWRMALVWAQARLEKEARQVPNSYEQTYVATTFFRAAKIIAP